MPEAITCPDRMRQAGPWEREEGLDYWRDGGESWDRFLWPWKPRRCSFCGSVHPDDAMRLLREGWTEEIADNRDKAYLRSPAHIAAMRAGLTGEAVYESEPKPPAKIRTVHLSEAQLKELNDIHFGGPA